MITTIPKPLSKTLHLFSGKQSLVPGIAFGLTCLLASPCLLAQAVDTDTSDDNEEVFVLEEYKVSDKSLKDAYVATESTAGTRFADKLISLPYSIDVFTEEMVEDFQLFSDDDILSLVGGATSDTGSTELRVRGFTSIKTRDGFKFSMPASPSNTKQTEFIKGPQSILYGRTAPGGIQNAVTRRPMKKPEYRFVGTFGTDNFRRASVTATGPIIKNKLYYFAYVDYMGSREFDFWGTTGTSARWKMDGVKNDSYYTGLSLLYTSSKDTSFYFTFEYQPARNLQGSGATVGYENSTREIGPDGYFTGNRASISGQKGMRAYDTGSFNVWYADNAYRKADFFGLNLLLEHRINTRWSTRASVQTYTKRTDKLRYAGGTSYFVDVDEFSARYPYSQDQDDNAVALQSELIGNWITKNAQHRLMLAVDGSLRKQDDTEMMYNTLAEFIPNKWRLKLNSPNPQMGEDIDSEYLRRTYGDTVLKTHTFGGLASYRIVFPRQNLTFMASARYDYYKDELDDRLATTHDTSGTDPSHPRYPKTSDKGDRDGSKLTYSFGVLYRIFGDKMLAFASTSTGYTPKSTIDHGTSTLVPPEESDSIEIGFKGTSDDNTMGYTLAAFYMTLEDISVANDDYTANLHSGGGVVPEYSTAGKQRSKGIEGRLFVRPLTGLTLIGNFGYINSEVKSAPDDNYNFVVGKPATMVAKWNASLIARYTVPKHILPGLSLGANARYRTEVTAYYENSDYYGKEMPSLWIMDGFVKYEWRNRKARHSVTVNLRNALDKKYYSRGGLQMMGREARLTYSLRY